MNIKRLFDLMFTIPGLIVLIPLFIVIAIWIKIDSPGPVFFRQKRVGQNGRLFMIWKFRTMVVDAERLGGAITVGDDWRITKVGSFLRKYKLDELPQLINVLRGEMSLVGPRPEVPYYVELYTEEQRAVLELVPGITDPASIKYRDESDLLATATEVNDVYVSPEDLYITKILPDKIRINLDYAKRANVASDFLVIIHTLFDFKAYKG